MATSTDHSSNSKGLESLELFRTESKRKEKPSIKDLSNHVIQRWASKWRQLGIQLNINQHQMDTVECDHPKDSWRCCYEILTKWLHVNPSACWEDIIIAVDSLSSNDNKNAVLQAAKILCVRYTQNRFIQSIDDWPPYHLEHYTPLTIVHHEQIRTEYEVENIAQETSATDILTETHCSGIYSKAIKNINDLFSSFENTFCIPYMILIEGSPGIGKTELSKEIALQWANNSVLKGKKLVLLLFARDSHVKKISNIQLLAQYFFQSGTLSNKITEWLIKTDGKYLTIIVDGYDELSTDRKDHCIIDSIISRQILTQCGIVITSRPIASSCLHSIVSCRAEVLGFTENDRRDFIYSALKGHNDKIEKLNEYLVANQHLNLLCYVPLNMTILLCLANEGIDILPKTQTVLYKNFILMTITHFLKKDKLLPTTSIIKFTDLPHPYDQVFEELSQFAFLAVQKDQLVFTLAEVKAECPKLNPSNWYGLGLLKPAQYFKPQDGCDHESFHFLHYSIQEYLAAYHIASLSDDKLLSLLEETFWNIRYFNTWIMYVGLTEGKQFIFTHFLSGNYFQVTSRVSTPKKVSKKFLNDKIKCLHILHCSAEADCEILSSVDNIFEGQIIDLSNSNLSVNNLCTLAILLLQSPNKEWKLLNLSRCNIDNNGCNVFCEMFHSQRVALEIKKVDISYNCIQWESLKRLCKLLKLWQTTDLYTSFDALYDNATMRVINSFTNEFYSNILQGLFTGMLLCTYMAEHQRMIVVYFDLMDYCIKSYQLDNCKLNNRTVNRIKDLMTKKSLDDVNYIAFSYRISYNEANVKSTMLSQHIQTVTFCGPNIHSKGACLMNVPSIIKQDNQFHQVVVDYLSAVLCHNIQTNLSYIKTIEPSLAITVESTFEKFSNLTFCDVTNNNISEEAADDIAAVLSHNSRLKELYLSENNLQSTGAIKIAKALYNSENLTFFSLSNNNISEEAADDIAAVLSHNSRLKGLYLGENNLQSIGAIKIAKALHNSVNLRFFDLSNNDISEEAAGDIAAVLSHNIKLEILELSGNKFQTSGAITIARALHKTVTLTSFSLSINNIGKEAADDIAAVLSHNSRLKELYLAGNNLQSTGAIKIAKALHNSVNLRFFNLSNNDINEEAAGDIAAVLSHNIKLEILELGGNKFQTSGAITITRALHKTVTLTSFGLSINNIGKEAADDIAAVLSHNSRLKKLYLAGNNLQSTGAINIAKALHNSVNLRFFNLSNNDISEEAAGDIAAVLSHNIKLEILELGGNKFQTSGAITITRALHKTVTLTSFGLSINNIGKEAADDIAAVLSHNIKLETLNLGGNKFQTSGAITIARALHKTVTLTSFDLSINNIGKEAADDIAAVLSLNTKLQVIYLHGNNLQSTGAIKIAKALHNFVDLKFLNLSNNNISEEAADDIATFLSHNTKLQKLYLHGNNL